MTDDKKPPTEALGIIPEEIDNAEVVSEIPKADEVSEDPILDFIHAVNRPIENSDVSLENLLAAYERIPEGDRDADTLENQVLATVVEASAQDAEEDSSVFIEFAARVLRDMEAMNGEDRIFDPSSVLARTGASPELSANILVALKESKEQQAEQPAA